MSRFYQIADPANTSTKHDAPMEDNAVLLSGYCSDVGVITNGKLCVGFMDSIQVLYGFDGQADVFFDNYYPIGSQIYVYMGNDRLNDEDVFAEKFYSSYYDVPIDANGGAWDHMDNGDDVFLMVELNANKTHWTPVRLIGTCELNPSYHAGKCLIRLGSTKGQYNVPPYTDCDKFMLEEQKPMFYYDGTNLIPFDVWLLSQLQNYFAHFKLPDTTVVELTDNSNSYSWDNTPTAVPSGRYLLGGQVVLASHSAKPILAHVLLRYKVGNGNYEIVSAADTVMPISLGSSMDGPQTVFLQGVVNLPSAPETLHIEMFIEAEVGSAVYMVHVVNNPPSSGTHIDGFDGGAQLFFQRVGDAISNN